MSGNIAPRKVAVNRTSLEPSREPRRIVESGDVEYMFCPQCGSTQPDELNFCKACGANLQSVRTALVTGAPGGKDKFDWNKTWLAEMMMSSEESARRTAEIERLHGKTAEVKRRNEIKAGVITASVGVSLTLVLSVIMEAIVINGRLSDLAADILSRVWIVGLIPIFVGLALIVNGVFISKKGAPAPSNAQEPEPDQLPAVDTNELPPAMPFSVTDNTTRHLDEAKPRSATRK